MKAVKTTSSLISKALELKNNKVLLALLLISASNHLSGCTDSPQSDYSTYPDQSQDQDEFDSNGKDINGRDREGYDSNGRDINGRDREGYDRDGLDINGRDKRGYDVHGRDAHGRNRDGYDSHGRDTNGRDRAGFDVHGRDADGYDTQGLNKYGSDRRGYDVNGRDIHGRDRRGFNAHGQNAGGYFADGFDAPAPKGRNCDGYDREGFNYAGFNRDGFDRTGFNRDGFDRAGFNREGLNLTGRNRAGYDRNGYDAMGLDRAGFYKDGFNRDGFDRAGFNRDGFNRAGLDRGGYDVRGLDQAGYDRRGYDIDGFNKTGLNRAGKHRVEQAMDEERVVLTPENFIRLLNMPKNTYRKQAFLFPVIERNLNRFFRLNPTHENILELIRVIAKGNGLYLTEDAAFQLILNIKSRSLGLGEGNAYRLGNFEQVQAVLGEVVLNGFIISPEYAIANANLIHQNLRFIHDNYGGLTVERVLNLFHIRNRMSIHVLLHVGSLLSENDFQEFNALNPSFNDYWNLLSTFSIACDRPSTAEETESFVLFLIRVKEAMFAQNLVQTADQLKLLMGPVYANGFNHQLYRFLNTDTLENHLGPFLHTLRNHPQLTPEHKLRELGIIRDFFNGTILPLENWGGGTPPLLDPQSPEFQALQLTASPIRSLQERLRRTILAEFLNPDLPPETLAGRRHLLQNSPIKFYLLRDNENPGNPINEVISVPPPEDQRIVRRDQHGQADPMIECPVCTLEIEENTQYLQWNNSPICLECAKDAIRTKIQDPEAEYPFYFRLFDNQRPLIEMPLNRAILGQMDITEDLMNQWEKATLLAYYNQIRSWLGKEGIAFKECPHPDCKFHLFREDAEHRGEENNHHVRCEGCGNEFCYLCLAEGFTLRHPDKPCPPPHLRGKALSYRNHTARPCPYCQQLAAKIGGCNGVKCRNASCGALFHWVKGKSRWKLENDPRRPGVLNRVLENIHGFNVTIVHIKTGTIENDKIRPGSVSRPQDRGGPDLPFEGRIYRELGDDTNGGEGWLDRNDGIPGQIAKIHITTARVINSVIQAGGRGHRNCRRLSRTPEGIIRRTEDGKPIWDYLPPIEVDLSNMDLALVETRAQFAPDTLIPPREYRVPYDGPDYLPELESTFPGDGAPATLEEAQEII